MSITFLEHNGKLRSPDQVEGAGMHLMLQATSPVCLDTNTYIYKR